MTDNRKQRTPAPRARSARVGRLDRAVDVRRELAALYRSARRDEVKAQDAARLASILAILLRSIELGEIEDRLDAMEQANDQLEDLAGRMPSNCSRTWQ